MTLIEPAIAPFIDIADPMIKGLPTIDCKLLIHISNSGIAHTIYHKVNNQFISLRYQHIHIVKRQEQRISYLKQLDVLGQRFKEVWLMIDPLASTLVPKALFDEKAVGQYLMFLTDVPLADIRYHLVPTTDCMIIDALEADLTKTIRELVLNPQIVSTNEVLLQQCLRENRHRKDDLLWVYLMGEQIHITALDKGKLVFSNQFTVKSASDVSYFMLSVAEQVSFNTETVNVYIISNGDEQYLNAINKYFNLVQIASRPSAFNYSIVMDALPVATFYPIFTLNACE